MFTINKDGGLVFLNRFIYYSFTKIACFIIFFINLISKFFFIDRIINFFIGFIVFSPIIFKYYKISSNDNVFKISSQLSRYVYLLDYCNYLFFNNKYYNIPYDACNLIMEEEIIINYKNKQKLRICTFYNESVKKFYIVAQGTLPLSLNDWFSNFDNFQEKLNTSCENFNNNLFDYPRSHFGYYSLINNNNDLYIKKYTYNNLNAKYDNILIENDTVTNYLYNKITKDYNNYEIILTGHSQGGGIIKILGYLLHFNKALNNIITVHSYAGVRVFNKSAADIINKSKLIIYNINYLYDIVPRAYPEFSEDVREYPLLISYHTTNINITIIVPNLYNRLFKLIMKRNYGIMISEDTPWFNTILHVLLGILNHDPNNYIEAMENYEDQIINIKLIDENVEPINEDIKLIN